MIHIFMNERIRQKRPKKPVIVAQQGGEQTEANRFNLYLGNGEILLGSVVFDRKGLAECETHEVKAWVELDPRVVTVREAPDAEDITTATAEPAASVVNAEESAPRPIASAKLPNQPVKFQ